MLALAYLGLMVFIAFLEITRKKVTKIDFITLFNLNYCFMYPLPAFFLDAALGNSSEMWFNDTFYISNLQTALAIFAGYFLVLIGFYSKSAEKLGKNIVIKSRSHKSVIIFAIFLLLFTCLSMYIYSSQYGGFLVTLSKTNLIRAGAEEHTGGLLFFKRFLYCSFFASYLLGSYVISHKLKKGRLFISTLFLISLIVSLLAFLLSGARAALINFLLVFYLGYVLKTGKFSWVLIILITCVSTVFIFYGKIIFFSLTALPDGLTAVVDKFIETKSNQPDSGEFNFYALIKNFAYPVYSLDTAFTQVYEPRFFWDWLYGFASLLPEKLTGLEIPETISYYNTYYIVKTNDYNIQPGFLAFGIYSMSWPGLIITCIISGWIGRYLQSILTNHLNDILYMPFIYVFLAEVWLNFQIFGNPQDFFQDSFWAILSTILLLLFVSKVSIISHLNHKINRGKSCVR
ncbi:MAG: oligosaccharide repeat unit polymerase [Iphinoe sp. HA4291-MV1]|jgi:hypothetical protein|nr:oligosaccharide repeat unit polymerase [Iphinoe sp. HA4291-MV1]